MKRIRIGKLFGSTGIFVSKPGNDVTVPGKQLTLDTRYEYLQVHERGSFNLDTSYVAPPADGRAYFKGSTTFTSLGYEPLFYFFVRAVNGYSNFISPYYPNLCAGVYYDDQFHVLQCGAQIVNNNTIQASFNGKADSQLSSWAPMACDYIIFKNKAVP